MNAHAIRISSLLVLSVMAACAETRIVGVTDMAGQGDPAPEARAKHRSIIVLSDDESLSLQHPILGDVDGDGYDDFLIHTLEDTRSLIAPTSTRIYLFYGRPQLPERLSTADADAMFRARDDARPLGDVNGDGLADFAISHIDETAYELVLGRRERFRGEVAPLSAGLVWRSEMLPPPFAGELRTIEMLEHAGDVNCDGIDDLLVTSMNAPSEDSSEISNGNFGLVQRASVVLGGAELPSGLWSPSWADGRFVKPPDPGHEEWQSGGAYYPYAVGDLDADGCDDVMSHFEHQMIVFHGRGSGWGGDASLAPDALFEPAGDADFSPIGDLDGDGALDLVALDFPGDSFGVVYGGPERWLDAGPPASAFTVELDPEVFQHGDFGAAVGDIDGDALPELVIGAASYGLQRGAALSVPRGAMYVIRGTGQRPVGTYRLTDADLLMLGPQEDLAPARPDIESAGAGLGASLNVAGDIDGDGGSEILSASPSAGARGAVYLIPSGPRPPE